MRLSCIHHDVVDFHPLAIKLPRISNALAVLLFVGEPYENRKQIVKLGLGPNTCDFKKITAEAITSAITECVSNDKYKKNAEEISQRLQNVNGIELTIQLIEKEFKK